LKQSPLGSVWIKNLTGEPGEEVAAVQGLEGLRVHYSIICLNDDKDIMKSDEVDAYTLSEMISGASPYLILIPKS